MSIFSTKIFRFQRTIQWYLSFLSRKRWTYQKWCTKFKLLNRGNQWSTGFIIWWCQNQGVPGIVGGVGGWYQGSGGQGWGSGGQGWGSGGQGWGAWEQREMGTGPIGPRKFWWFLLYVRWSERVFRIGKGVKNALIFGACGRLFVWTAVQPSYICLTGWLFVHVTLL